MNVSSRSRSHSLKTVLNNNISFTSLWPTLAHSAEIGLVVWCTPSRFQRVLYLGFVTAATSLSGSQPNFARCFAVSWAGTLCIHFLGLLPPDRILPCAIFTLRPSLVFSYIGSVTAEHSSIGRTVLQTVAQLTNCLKIANLLCLQRVRC